MPNQLDKFTWQPKDIRWSGEIKEAVETGLGFDSDLLYEQRTSPKPVKVSVLKGQEALNGFAKTVGRLLHEHGVKGQKWGKRKEKEQPKKQEEPAKREPEGRGFPKDNPRFVGNLSDGKDLLLHSAEQYRADKAAGWWVAPNGDLLDVTNEVSGGTNDHVGFLMIGDNPGLLGLSKEEGETLKKAYIEGEGFGEEENRAFLKIFSNGFIRARYFGGNSNTLHLDSEKMDDRVLTVAQKFISKLADVGPKTTTIEAGTDAVDVSIRTLLHADSMQDLIQRAKHPERESLREGRKLHYKTEFQDIPISVENRIGSIRRGTDPDGDEWKTKMKRPYGYIPGTKGVDGDELDVFVGPDENAAFAYIVHSNDPETGKFDEDKILLGFKSREAAKRCFLQHYDSPKFFGGMDEIPMWKFDDKVWIKKHTTKKLVASMRESLNGMKRSILGHHPDIMVDPRVREQKRKKKVREHGVQGMHWGEQKSDFEQKYGKSKKKSGGVKFLGDEPEEELTVKDPYTKEEPEEEWKPQRDPETEKLMDKLSKESKFREGKVYYARPSKRYGTSKESKELEFLENEFPEDRIVALKTCKKRDRGMDYFHKKVDASDRVIISPVSGRKISAGVFSEAQHALHRGIPVHMIHKGRLHEVKKLRIRKNPKQSDAWADVILKKKRKK